jgi:sulfite reductase alpha subunit-like flavoprotein
MDGGGKLVDYTAKRVCAGCVVQDLIEDKGAQFLELMTGPDAVFYFCGLKRMYAGVMEVLLHLGEEQGVDVPACIAQLKKEHRWHVETA